MQNTFLSVVSFLLKVAVLRDSKKTVLKELNVEAGKKQAAWYLHYISCLLPGITFDLQSG